MYILSKYNIIENTSKVYYNGSVWESNNCGSFEIVAKLDRFVIDKRGYKISKYFLCKFDDGTTVDAKTSEIKLGKVRNPNCPSLCNKGYLGVGKWRFYINQRATKEYSLFSGIITRCYNTGNLSYKYYGQLGITLEEEMHNFQVFCDVISKLPNYDIWKKDKDQVWEVDKDIMCEKLNISPKIYSRKTMRFVLVKDNIAERNQRVSVTGFTYLGISPDGEEHEFKNIKEFSRKNNLCDTHVGSCARGKAMTHRGWTFKIKE